VLLELYNDQYRAKVADFGLATVNPKTGKNREGCGTAMYLAPEEFKILAARARGSVKSGSRSATSTDGAGSAKSVDVYAFGIMCIDILGMMEPWLDKVDAKAVEAAVLAGERPEMPADVSNVIIQPCQVTMLQSSLACLDGRGMVPSLWVDAVLYSTYAGGTRVCSHNPTDSALCDSDMCSHPV
jgi:serine/threonine protein kinase